MALTRLPDSRNAAEEASAKTPNRRIEMRPEIATAYGDAMIAKSKRKTFSAYRSAKRIYKVEVKELLASDLRGVELQRAIRDARQRKRVRLGS